MGPPMDVLTDVTAWLRTEESFLLKRNIYVKLFLTTPLLHVHHKSLLSPIRLHVRYIFLDSYFTSSACSQISLFNTDSLYSPTPPHARRVLLQKTTLFERSGSSGVALLPNPPKRFDTFQWENTHFSTLGGVERSITKP